MELHQKNEGPDKTVIPCRSIFQGCNHVSTTIMKLCKVISRLLQCNKTVEGGDGNKVTRLSEKKKKKKSSLRTTVIITIHISGLVDKYSGNPDVFFLSSLSKN